MAKTSWKRWTTKKRSRKKTPRMAQVKKKSFLGEGEGEGEGEGDGDAKDGAGVKKRSLG